ncbi:TolC family protein [Thiobacillus sedimenti]|uniref:TolC family protein n=1 Tax=Thiobacillus sedimenti TaxID=3110231 RepID=A0ABZ1CJ25_9PROT|nr:TolC family protein [Thiobacillus sp. SCUT-2]WRS38861.1 TolC family protein [Thiobacillus sp. SCUT-2]
MKALALLCLSVFSAGAAAETLDFAQAVQRALDRNPDILVAGAQVAQAQAAVRQSEGARLPKVTASFNVTRTDDALNAFGLKLSQRNATFNDFGAAEFTGPTALNVAPHNLNYPDPVNNFNARLEAQLPIYTGGMITGYNEQANAYLRAARQGDAMARQKVIFDVLRAYEGVHTARAYEDVARLARSAAESYVKTIGNLLKGGVVVKSDLLSAQVHLEDVKVQQAQAENAVGQALDQLHLLLGTPLTAPLDVAGTVEVRPLAGTLADYQSEALKSNPGLAALRNQVDAAQAAVKVARAGRYPQAGLLARFDTNDKNAGFDAHSYTLGGQVSWQLFDGGVTSGAIQRAQASREELAAKLQQAENGIAYQVAEAWRRADEAQRRVTARELAVSQAEEAQRLVQKRYASGVTTITELLGAQAQLDKARADLVAARYDLKVQRANARLVTGRLQPDHM